MKNTQALASGSTSHDRQRGHQEPIVTAPKPKPLLKRVQRLRQRHWIQLVVFVITIGVRLQFAAFVHQAAGTGPVTIQRPPGVEAFLPIGALMGWKLFITTGVWDPIHPAAMVLLATAALLSFAFRKSFCAWLCPVGTLSEWLWRLGRRLMGRNVKLPLWLDYPLRSVKYLLLGFFVWVIFQMPTAGIIGFLQSPHYKMSDVKMLHFFTQMSLLTGVVLVVLTIASLFVRNFWCRYLCPYGALMGLLALIGPTRIQRDRGTCIDCGRCAKACPYNLPVDRKTRIVSAECIGCLDCQHACPIAGTLTFRTGGPRGKRWSAAAVAMITASVLVVSIYGARITGYWQSRVSIMEFRHLLKQIDSPHMTHPSIGGKPRQ